MMMRDASVRESEMKGNRRRTKTVWAVLVGLGLFAATTVAQTYDIVKAFSSEGLSPWAGLIQGTDGNLYGTTSSGGGGGTIFKIDTSGSMLTTLHSFVNSDGAYPYGGVIQGADGNLYGTTAQGGASDSGTIFKIDTNGTTFTTLHNFAGSDGAKPYGGLIQGTDGSLYGTTIEGGANNYGTIFKIDTNGSTLTTLHSFAGSDGWGPYAGLIQGTDGNLYGMTIQGGLQTLGTIFKIDTSATTFTTLHDFAYNDGAYPWAGLMQGTDGNLYGTTTVGGTSGLGTIFKIDTNGAMLTTLHSFVGSDGAGPYGGLIQATDGNLYGTTTGYGTSSYGTVFKIDTGGTTLTTLHSFVNSDGAFPLAGLVQATDGDLYGTTRYGGNSSCYGGCGTVFKIDTSGMSFTTLHSFVYYSDGAYPYGGLIRGTDGGLYGTAREFGGSLYGTIFKIDADGAAFTKLHSFVGSDGAYPDAGLMQSGDGNLYGTTAFGGTGSCYLGCGTIFKIDTSGTTLTTLRDFAGSDGAAPSAGLMLGTDGNLYGTTAQGGANGYGTIFKIDTSGTTLTTLHSFDYYSEGGYPKAGLIQGTDGNLYGTASRGGPNCACGTIFKIDTSGTTFTMLHSFDGSDGGTPYAGLIQGTDGSLYGTTSGFGISSYGTIFRIDTDGSTFTTLHSFANSDGAAPSAGLMLGTDGNLYGTTSQGGAGNAGTIFKIDTNGATLTTLYSFTSTDGAGPWAALIQAADGSLHGTTSSGGPGGGGVVFRLRAPFVAVAVSPTSGAASGGTAVTVSGTGFDPTNTVFFSGVAATGVNFVSQTQIDTTSPPLSPGTLNDVSVTSPTAVPSTLPKAFLADFLDVPQSDGFHNFVEKIFRNGITAGYGNGNYGRDDSVTRAQMAVFLLRAEHGSSYTPPACTPPGIFGDVACPGGFAVDWIEQLSSEGITAGCGGGDYCPDNPVTRAQMAVFLLRAEHGSGYTPPACSGIFQDVECMPTPAFAVDWIEQLYNESVTGGCSSSPLLYCPDKPNTRGQMAVFLTTTFGLM